MEKIVVLVWNNFTNDKRVMNLASFFAKNYDTTVLAAKTIAELQTCENKNYNIYRIPLVSSLLKNTKKSNFKFEKSLTEKKNFYDKYIKRNQLKLIVLEFLNVIVYDINTFFYVLKTKPLLVYCNDLDTLGIGYFSSIFVRSKIIYDSHEIFLDGSRYHKATFIRKTWWRFLESKLIRKVNEVIVTTDFRKEILIKKYNINNINVIRNCHSKTDLIKKDLFRKEFGIQNDIPILLYQGGLTKVRGIFKIVEIVCDIPDIAVVFMGMGEDKQKLIEFIIEKNINDRVFVKNAVDPIELIDYTSSADIGLQLLQNINLNHYSTISNKIFEYMAAGLAIIASDFPEIRKIINYYHLGIVVNPASKEDIKSAILELISNKKMLMTMKGNSLKAAQENTWEKEEKKLESIIKKFQLA